MKEITIPVPDGKRAEWINGVLTLVDEPKVDNRPVTERIKTFTDACNALGNEHPFVTQYRLSAGAYKGDPMTEDFIAYLKLRIIVAALNEGLEPKFEKGEHRYYPWFYLYTKEEYDKLNDEEKGRCVLRSGVSTILEGYVNCSEYDNASCSSASRGSRLAFITRELAAYAGRQFIEEWADFMFKPRTGEELNEKQRASESNQARLNCRAKAASEKPKQRASESNQTRLNCQAKTASVEPKSEAAKTTIDFTK